MTKPKVKTDIVYGEIIYEPVEILDLLGVKQHVPVSYNVGSKYWIGLSPVSEEEYILSLLAEDE